MAFGLGAVKAMVESEAHFKKHYGESGGTVPAIVALFRDKYDIGQLMQGYHRHSSEGFDNKVMFSNWATAFQSFMDEFFKKAGEYERSKGRLFFSTTFKGKHVYLSDFKDWKEMKSAALKSSHVPIYNFNPKYALWLDGILSRHANGYTPNSLSIGIWGDISPTLPFHPKWIFKYDKDLSDALFSDGHRQALRFFEKNPSYCVD